MSTKKDLALNVTSHDLDMQSNNFYFVDSLDYIKQKLKIKLLFVFGEWFLDTIQGVKYQDILWVKNPIMRDVDATIKATIMDTEGVLNILTYTSNLDNATRQLTISFSVNTTEGEINNMEVVI
jgi:hypothetical protein